MSSFTLIWICWSDDQRSSSSLILISCQSKVFFNFDMEWKCRSKVFFYFDLELLSIEGLLQLRSRVIVDQRSSSTSI